MNKLFTQLSLAIVVMGVGTLGWTANPCKPIAQACMKLGYYKGGNKVGKGLVENCVLPVSNNQKTLPGTNFSQNVLQQCNSLIMSKMKSR